MEMIKSRELERLFPRPVCINLPHQGLRQFYWGTEKFYMHTFENTHIFIAYCKFCNFSDVFTCSNAWLRRKYQAVMSNGKNRQALNI